MKFHECETHINRVMITCIYCHVNKQDIEFSKNKNKKSGRNSFCKLCKKEYNKTNKLRIDETRKKYKTNHSEKLDICQKRYVQENKSKIKVKTREYYDNHKPEILLKTKNYINYKLKNDPYFKFTQLLRGRIRSGIKCYSKNGKTMACKEYGINFKEIYDKVGPRPSNEYHLDHIIPFYLFNLDNPEHVKLANCADNLRWIEAFTNLSKNKRIDMSLIINNKKLKEIYEKITNTSLNNN